MFLRTLSLSALALAPSALGAVYNLQDNIVGKNFLDNFNHENIPDPTHGRGIYVDEKTALAQNLTFVSDNTLVIRADSTTVLKASDPGRNTVRLVSKKTFTTHVAVFDVRHIPQGCGTWPAAWEVGNNWPVGGEVDIIEGVNDVSPNAMTLHTSTGCTMPDSGRTMTGAARSTNCDAKVNGNTGCGVAAPQKESYGPAFNQAGGGIYAMERTSEAIKVWFFPRSGNGAAPKELAEGSNSIDVSTFGTPTALFPNTQCNIDEHFAAHNIVINLALCGDWAGNTFNGDGCQGNCVDLVNSNPGAFKDAFWDIAAVRVYTPGAAKRSLPEGGRMVRKRRSYKNRL